MKLAHITTSNFLGARAVELKLSKPVSLIAGKNGAGKSSIQEAVRMALTGETVRVSLKKDYGALISEGQESGFAAVECSNAGYEAVLPSGKGNHSDNAALPYVLDAQRFARMTDNERRQFLFGLMGVKLDGPAIKQRLLDKGCDAGKIEQIAPILRAGFDAAAKEAASKARDAKASYKTATGGDTWGKDKGGKWQPAPLPVDADKSSARYDNAVEKRKEADAELAVAQQELGAAKAAQRQANEAESKRLELHNKASSAERIQARLNHDTAELVAWEEKVATTRAKAGVVVNPKAPGEFLLRGLAAVTRDFLTLSNDFPEVQWPSELLNRAAAHYNEYVKLHGDPADDGFKPDPEAVANLPKHEEALKLMQSAVANGKRDLEAAQMAAEKLKGLDGLKANSNVEALQTKVNDLTAKRDGWNVDVEKYRDIADKYARRETLIKQVAQMHADVLAWTDIADALAPDGIPAELLAEALDPINEHLRISAANAEWEPAQINADMTITYGLRHYALISESEKWRADAMIAEAVSHISGVKLLVLDRFDVLDLKGREDALYWLDGMAEDGDIETALLFGTLKALPAQLLPNIEGFWVENGMAGQIKEAA